MTRKEIEHVKDCKELMQEAANRIDMIIKLNEYQTGEKMTEGIEIQLRDKENYLIYKSYDVSNTLGFIHGYEYAKEAGQHDIKALLFHK